MSQLLACLYPKTFIPPHGKLVPRPRVIEISDKELDCTARAISKAEKIEACYLHIKSGVNTSEEIAAKMGVTRATALNYFRDLESAGRCYGIYRGGNTSLLLLAY